MTKRSLLLLTLVAALALAWVGAAAAKPAPQGHLAGLSAKERKEIVTAARAYFDPSLESIYTEKTEFIRALGVLNESHGLDALKDVGILREIVYQGRGFKPRLSDKKWRSQTEVKEFKKTQGLYQNLKSEEYRFTYSLPKGYPKAGPLAKKIPRTTPHPVLFVFHEDRDTKTKSNDSEPYPGATVLARRYPKGSFGDLYRDWFVLAPVAPRAKFLDDEGHVRQRLVMWVLNLFWQRYHVDFDRIVADGGQSALALTALYPNIFAGLVLRDGEVNVSQVQNMSTVPVYVMGKPALKKALDAAGHPDVTVGDEQGLAAWLEARRRQTPKAFQWNVLSPQHIFANWIWVGASDLGANPTLDVEVIDTEESPNTIRIDAKGIDGLSLFLNDQIVDLDRDVTLILNGKKTPIGKLKREFRRLFEKPVKVRDSMLFSWLFPTFVDSVSMPAPQKKPKPTPEEVPDDPEGTPTDEANAKKFWDKAAKAEAAGDKDKARRLYQRVADIGQTSLRGKAKKKVKELQ